MLKRYPTLTLGIGLTALCPHTPVASAPDSTVEEKPSNERRASTTKQDAQSSLLGGIASAALVSTLAYYGASTHNPYPTLHKTVETETNTLHKLIVGAIHETNFNAFVASDTKIRNIAKDKLAPHVPTFQRNILQQINAQDIQAQLNRSLPTDHHEDPDVRLQSPYIAALRLWMYDTVTDFFQQLKKDHATYKKYLTKIQSTTHKAIQQEKNKITDLHPDVTYLQNPAWNQAAFTQHLKQSR